jgi:hypothetical protein
VQAENHINLIAFTWVVLFGGSFKQQGVRMQVSEVVNFVGLLKARPFHG